MTPEQLRNAAEVMMAASRGEKIEYKLNSGYCEWEIVNIPLWNWTDFDYRIAVPEKKIIRVAPAIIMPIKDYPFISSLLFENEEKAKEFYPQCKIKWPAMPLIEIEIEE